MNMALNKVNIEFLRKQMDKVLEDIEKLKDANREMKYTRTGVTHNDRVCSSPIMFVNAEIQGGTFTRRYGNVYAASVMLKDNIVNLSVQMLEGSAELESNIDGSKSIKKLIIE